MIKVDSFSIETGVKLNAIVLVFLNKEIYMNSIQEPLSVFAQMVDKLRTKTDAELKMLYIQFFKDDFINDWGKITSETNFSTIADEEIIAVIENKRYKTE